MSDRIRNKSFLTEKIRKSRSLLCIGLDTVANRLPASINGDILEFNKAIIDATRHACIAYKPNFAFYEAMGAEGWRVLEETIAYIGDEHLIIADAKRGDIGNTSRMYAEAVFDRLGCDAITVNPYMGEDCVRPFYKESKWVIILALTSNAGSQNFQKKVLDDGHFLYQEIMHTSASWGSPEDTMFVLGATHPSEVEACRKAFPDHFFLIPGIGAQGGDLNAICEAGVNDQGGLLINASRSILYASDGSDFAEAAQREASRMNEQFKPHLQRVGLI